MASTRSRGAGVQACDERWRAQAYRSAGAYVVRAEDGRKSVGTEEGTASQSMGPQALNEESRMSLGAAAAMQAPPPKVAPPPRPGDEVELASMPTSMPASTSVGRVGVKLGSSEQQQLHRPRKSKPRRRSSDVREEGRLFGSRGSRECPPSHRASAGRQSQVCASDLRDSDDRASGVVVGRARGNSLVEEPSACWLTLRSSSSAPCASVSGAGEASVSV
jgi:hypothetical protein